MEKTKIGIIGLRTVGSGVARLLLDFGDRTGLRAGRTLWLEKAMVCDLKKARDSDLPEGGYSSTTSTQWSRRTRSRWLSTQLVAGDAKTSKLTAMKEILNPSVSLIELSYDYCLAIAHPGLAGSEFPFGIDIHA